MVIMAMASGRQREFDKQMALSAAMQVFWKKGYVGASLAELCDAMGINKPSMYAAFGNKESLFLAATDYYIEFYAKKHVQVLMGQASLRSRLRAYLHSVVAEQCAGEHPKGCYISLCVAESASDALPDKAFEKVEYARDYAESYLSEFLGEEQVDGRLSAEQDSAVIAKSLITLLHGTASMARGGASFDSLAPVIELALNSITFADR